MQKSAIQHQEVIFSTGPLNQQIYIREQSGFYQRIRRSLNILLLSLFVLIPFIPYQGHQAVYFDVGAQKFHFFAYTLYPQDLGIFALVFILAAFLLFAVTKVYGRVWCGFTCPQTVWTLMFNWIERRIEGSNHQSRSLDKQPISFNKLAKKTTKHTLWIGLSLLTSLVFMSYFVPVYELYGGVFSFELSTLITGWVGFFAVCTYVNGGWVREKMCQHMCPYSRFQAAMFDKGTKLVTYDAQRGESRGPRKRNQSKPNDKGDCVDCGLCVQVCPVGIDIRNGMQYECINCGLCVDACDATMDKFNYPRSLIDFTSETPEQSMKDQKLAYGLAIGMTIMMIAGWAMSRENVEFSVIRDRQALYRVNYLGHTENTYTIKVLNKSNQEKSYTLAIAEQDDFSIKGASEFNLAPGELLSEGITLVTEKAFAGSRHPITLIISDNQGGQKTKRNVTFFSD